MEIAVKKAAQQIVKRAFARGDIFEFIRLNHIYQSIYKEECITGDKVNIEDLNICNFNDTDYFDLPISKNVGIDESENRVIQIYDLEDRAKLKYISIENDYVLVLEKTGINDRFIDLPKITQQKARKLNDLNNRNYYVIPRAYAEALKFKIITDTKNLQL